LVSKAANVVLAERNEYVAVDAATTGTSPGLYRPNASATLPLTLTGAWATDSANLLLIGDDVFRQELAAPNGAELIGYLSGTVAAALSGVSLSVKAYGALGDGATDDTAAAQAACDAAAALGGVVHWPASSGEYLIGGKVEIRNGVRGFTWGGGEVKFTSVTGGFRLRGIHSGEPANVRNFSCINGRFNANDLEGASGMRIFDGENVQGCVFAFNQIRGMVHGYGISLFAYEDGVDAVQENFVVFNQITGIPGITKDVSGVRWYPVSVSCSLKIAPYADAVEHYIATGVAASGTRLALRNTIAHNHCDGGYYGITLISALYNTVMGNTLYNNIRGIAMEWTASENIVQANRIFRNVSTGILMGYGCSDNLVDANRINTEIQWIGEALIKCGLGSQRNTISRNKTKTSNNVATGEYHIYVHCDASDNSVLDNELYGDCARAYIGVESAWNSTQTAVEHFAQGKGSSLNDLSHLNMNNVAVKGNTIRAASTKSTVPTAIYFGQINDNKGSHVLSGCVIEDNVITSEKHIAQLKVIEMSSGLFQRNVLKNNTFERTSIATDFVLPRMLGHFSETSGNTFIDESKINTGLPVGDTTPSVSLGKVFALQNTSATSVTYFDDGVDGREFLLRMDAFTTLVHNNAQMRLKGNVNVAPSSTNNFITLRREGGVWLEVGRNF